MSPTASIVKKLWPVLDEDMPFKFVMKISDYEAQRRSKAMMTDSVGNSKTALLALTAIVITVVALWITNASLTPSKATWEDLLFEAEARGYKIMSTDELAERYKKDPTQLLLVDTRQEWEYRTGHIKGALNFPMEPTWWARWRKSSDLEAFLGRDKERLIVFY